MDLSPTRFDRAIEVGLPPVDITVLTAGMTARAASSVTALIQAEFVGTYTVPSRFAPADGHFNARMAWSLWEWRYGEGVIHQHVLVRVQADAVTSIVSKGGVPPR